MTALGVNHDGVDAHRVELPFPPHVSAVAALAPADTVGAVARFQHQAFAGKRPRLLALLRKLFPSVGGNGRADTDRQALATRLRFRDQAIDELFELGPPHMLRLGSKIATLAFQNVIGDEGDRQLALRLFADDLAAEPLLQAGEDCEAIERILCVLVFGGHEHHELAVNGRARGSARASGSRSG